MSLVAIRPQQHLIRRVATDDGDALARMFARSSPRTIYQRFLAAYPRGIPAPMLAMMVDVDHRAREALVVEVDGEIVAEGRYHTISPCVAEIAVVVEDSWQRRGLGRALVEALTERARANGIVEYRGVMLAENQAAFGLFNAMFPGGRTWITGGEREFRIPIAQASLARDRLAVCDPVHAVG